MVTSVLVSSLVVETLLVDTPAASVSDLVIETLMVDPVVRVLVDDLVIETLMVDVTNRAYVDAVVIESLNYDVVEFGESVNSTDTYSIIQNHYFAMTEAANAGDGFTTTTPPLSAKQPAYQPVPYYLGGDATEWMVSVSRATNGLLAGNSNTILDSLTLDADTTTTLFVDSRIGNHSSISFAPLTEQAANEKIWVSDQKEGSAVLNHSNLPDTLRRYRVNITG